MKYSQWEVRWKARPEGILWEVYRAEIGGEFTDKEEAEHLAYELNREANDGADK